MLLRSQEISDAEKYVIFLPYQMSRSLYFMAGIFINTSRALTTRCMVRAIKCGIERIALHY